MATVNWFKRDRTYAVGLTVLPDDLPRGVVWSRRSCGCYLVGQPGFERVHEFVCEHGYMVGVERQRPRPYR